MHTQMIAEHYQHPVPFELLPTPSIAHSSLTKCDHHRHRALHWCGPRGWWGGAGCMRFNSRGTLLQKHASTSSDKSQSRPQHVPAMIRLWWLEGCRNLHHMLHAAMPHCSIPVQLQACTAAIWHDPATVRVWQHTHNTLSHDWAKEAPATRQHKTDGVVAHEAARDQNN